MKTNFRRSSVAALLAGAFLATPSWAVAQDGADAATPHAHDMAGMDHSDMAHADMAHAQAPKEPAATPALDHDALHGMGSASDSVPANARSPDYSDGIGYHAMQGMDMLDNAPFGMLLVDRIEAFHGSNANGQAWEVEGWYGNDVNKLWLRSEGERSGGSLKDADLEAFWNRTVTAFWSTQVGVRHDFGEGPSRTWAAVGVQGLAPYWFELEATAYVGAAGRTAARVRADYELLLTQRLILQPEVEINLYGRDDPARHIGSGLSDVQFGLRLRYEISRQFAPYLGVNWIRSVGTTADYARDISQPVLDRQVVAGIRLWF